MAHNSSSVSDTCLFSVELVAKLVTDVMDEEGTLDVVGTAVTCTDELLIGCAELVVAKLVTDVMDEEGILDVVRTAVTCTDELVTGCAELVIAKLVIDETLDVVRTTFVDTATGFVMMETTAV